jgi:DNA-binding MarR family transcriptional regulator
VTEPQWVTLSLLAIGGGTMPTRELLAQARNALKLGDAGAAALVFELDRAQLVRSDDDDSAVTLTDAGRELHARLRARVGEITQRLWGEIPEDDLQVAGRVLAQILEHADAELAAD